MLSLEWDVFIKPLPSRLRKLCRRKIQKDCKNLMTDYKKQHLPDTKLMHMWIHRDHENMGKICIKFKPDKNSSMKNRKWLPSPTPSQEVICNWFLVGKGKSFFCNGVSLCMLATLHARPHAQESWLTPRDLRVVLCFVGYCFILLCFAYFCLIGIFCLFWFSFLNVCLLRERLWSWVVGSIWEKLGVGETW